MSTNMTSRPLRDFSAPISVRFLSPIVQPHIEAESFQLDLELISMIQGHKFGGEVSESPYQHLETFLELCDVVNCEGVSADAVRLMAFPFSIKDKARTWLYSLRPQSITSWEQLEKQFLNQFFPPSRTIYMRSCITHFAQVHGESLFEAWDRFKSLQRQCPHHGLEKWLILHIFYRGISFADKCLLDSSAGGSLMDKSIEEAYTLIEQVTLNLHGWSSKSWMKSPLIIHEVQAINVREPVKQIAIQPPKNVEIQKSQKEEFKYLGAKIESIVSKWFKEDPPPTQIRSGENCNDTKLRSGKSHEELLKSDMFRIEEKNNRRPQALSSISLGSSQRPQVPFPQRLITQSLDKQSEPLPRAQPLSRPSLRVPLPQRLVEVNEGKDLGKFCDPNMVECRFLNAYEDEDSSDGDCDDNAVVGIRFFFLVFKIKERKIYSEGRRQGGADVDV